MIHSICDPSVSSSAANDTRVGDYSCLKSNKTRLSTAE
jgi:hypothetical protein